MGVEIRTITESEVGPWVRAMHTGFHRSQAVSDEEVALARPGYDLDRTRAAFDGDRIVGTFRSMARDLTVPGGGSVSATAVTNVSVTATHRRRGLAGRLMAADLAAAKERGEAVAILIAAEYPIYGRFGFGPATWVADWEVDVPRAVLPPRHPDPGSVELVTPAEVRALGPALHERVRVRTPGAISRDGRWWDRATGAVVLPSFGYRQPFFVVHRDSAGEVDGMAAYRVNDPYWPHKLPNAEAEVLWQLAATPDADAALWRYLLSLDWVVRLKSGHRPPDDILPLLLGDPRAARTETCADYMWLRVLDVPVALSARSYAPLSTGLVLDVRDADGLAGGTFRLETAPGAAPRCTPAPASPPDLTLEVATLGRLYLGDESAERLSALGLVTEHRPGAATTASHLFRTPRRPWCPEEF